MWAYLSVPYEVRLPSLERNSPQQNEAENPDEMGVSCYSMRSGELACQCLQMENYVITKDGGYRSEQLPLRLGLCIKFMEEHKMEIDVPEVVAEVRAAFERYEEALVSNDVATLDELFRDDPRTVRYGVTENLYGHGEIRSFRAARLPVALGRKLSRTVITTFGRDFAVASTLYERPSAPGMIGRQTQTWVKFPEGWRVVVGHVSLMEKPAT